MNATIQASPAFVDKEGAVGRTYFLLHNGLVVGQVSVDSIMDKRQQVIAMHVYGLRIYRQNMGLGTLLMNDIIRMFHPLPLTLNAVPDKGESMNRLVAFYQRLGFVVMEWKKEGTVAYMMRA